ncbi:MAG: hypothetical protein Tsb0015_04860 [Simkaniaceae bacterium]
MSMFFRKLPLAIALAGSASAFAAADMDSRVTELERQMSQVRIVTPNGTCGANTALANPILDECGECCSSWFVEGSVLLWHPKVGGTEFAYTDQDPQARLKIKGKTKDMDFDWDWGFKIAVGYLSERDGWEVLLRYTWFDSHGSQRTSAGRSDSIVPLRGTPTLTFQTLNGDFIYCTKAKSQFDYTLNAIDLELARHYYVSETLSLRPFIGLKAAWLDLQQITRYSGGILSGSESTGLGQNSVHIKDDNEFWGLGPRIGGSSNWHLGQGYSIFGSFASSMLYSRFEVDHRERFSVNKNINRTHLDADRHAFVPVVEFMLGAQYDRYINNDRNHLRIRLSFESQYWWRTNQAIKVDFITSTSNNAVRYDRYSEDSSMHGVTLDFRIDF